MKPEFTTCPNCEMEHDQDFVFCPYCGQKTDEKITIGNLFYNTISNYFSFDARFFKSFIPLLFRPGYLPKKFIEGKRLLYLHPAQMYLFVSVIFFFLFSFIEREQASEINKALHAKESTEAADVLDSLNIETDEVFRLDSISNQITNNPAKFGMSEEEGKKLDSIIKKSKKSGNVNLANYVFSEKKLDSLLDIGAEDKLIYTEMGMSEDASFLERKFFGQILKFYKNRDGGSVLNTFYDAIPIAMFILLPFFALIIFLFYFNKGRFAHHLIFSFYFFSFQFALFSIIVAVNLIWDIPDWIDWLLVFSTYFYFLLALKRYYMQGWILTTIKSLVLSGTFMLFVLPLSAGLVLAYAFLFF